MKKNGCAILVENIEKASSISSAYDAKLFYLIHEVSNFANDITMLCYDIYTESDDE